MARTRRLEITTDFAGAATPAGSIVKFHGPGGADVRGKVTSIRVKSADVMGDDGREWSVPYAAVAAVEYSPAHECELPEIAVIASGLIDHHLSGGNSRGKWAFGFDLAPSRAGVCRYRECRIDLSVNFCLAATRGEIEDTILHEIAHAIVGPQHNHDAVWKAKAREIGCVGERCHRVQQSIPKWVGECGCGQQWFRQTLQRRMVGTRICGKCSGTITWRRNTGSDSPS